MFFRRFARFGDSGQFVHYSASCPQPDQALECSNISKFPSLKPPNGLLLRKFQPVSRNVAVYARIVEFF